MAQQLKTLVRRHQQLALRMLALGALAFVFLLYTNPDFVVTTANQVWFCFQ